MQKTIRNAVMLAELAEGVLPEIDSPADATEGVLTSILCDVIRYSVYPKQAQTNEYVQEYCNLFQGGVKYAKILSLLLRQNWMSAKTDTDLSTIADAWMEILQAYYDAKEEGEYSFFDYLGDMVKIKFISTCYFVISERTAEVRKVAAELKQTSADYERFERTVRNI